MMKVKHKTKAKMMTKVTEEKTKRAKRKIKSLKRNLRNPPKKIFFNKFCKIFTVMLTNQIITFPSWKMKSLMSS